MLHDRDIEVLRVIGLNKRTKQSSPGDSEYQIMIHMEISTNTIHQIIWQLSQSNFEISILLVKQINAYNHNIAKKIANEKSIVYGRLYSKLNL